jgi:hypothetical protein
MAKPCVRSDRPGNPIIAMIPSIIAAGFSRGFLGQLNYPARVFKPLLTATLLARLVPAGGRVQTSRRLVLAGCRQSLRRANIVGNAVLENQTVTFLTSKSVKRVYGSYGTQPVTSPSVSATWNAKLHAAGIQSQFLMSETTSIFPSNHPALLTKISLRVLDFNSAPWSHRFPKV